MKNKEETEDNLDVSKAKSYDKSGIRTHAPFETRKLLLVVELRYTLTWRLGPTRPSYQLVGKQTRIWLHEPKAAIVQNYHRHVDSLV
jgi:hypothetical protein